MNLLLGFEVTYRTEGKNGKNQESFGEMGNKKSWIIFSGFCHGK